MSGIFPLNYRYCVLLVFIMCLGCFAQDVSFSRDTYSLPQRPVSFAINGDTIFHADLNNDGREDIVFAGIGSTTFEVMLSTGDGTYDAPQSYSLPASNWTAMTIGDFNLDGWPDLLFTDGESNLYEFLNDKNGSFHLQTTFVVGAPIYNLAAGDFNHDGKIDIAFETENNSQLVLNLWFSNGDGSFTPGPSTNVSDSGDLYVGDFDGDGNADVVIEDVFYVTNAIVLYGDGKGNFPASLSFSDDQDTWFRPFDLNGDGKMDLVGSPFLPGTHGNEYFNVVRVKYGNADRSFTSKDITIGSCSPQGYSPAVADLNGDGINDIAVVEAADCQGSAPFSLDILLGKSDGTYEPERKVYSSSDTLWGPDPFRVNQDSKADLELINLTENSSTLMLFSNNVSGHFPKCNPPNSSSGIILCSPTTSVVSSTSVPFSIGAANQTAGRKVEVWVDGKKLGENLADTFSYYSFLDRKFNLTAGQHSVTIYTAGWDNMLQSLTFPLTVGSTVCSPPQSPGVVVCSPLNSSRVSSPVQCWAAGTVSGTIARMEVWVDGIKKFTTTGSNTLNTQIELATGAHVFTYYIVNTAGQKWQATVTATVP
jgi:hypothetical protein